MSQPVTEPVESKKRKLEESDETLEPHAISTLLGFISNDTLIDLVKTEAAQNASFCRLIRDKADEDPDNRKLFVRGLAWGTSSDQVLQKFQEFGAIEDGVVCMDKATGKSKGFGFVTFASVEGALKALESETHDIQGRTAYVRLAKQGANGKGDSGQQQHAPAAAAPAMMGWAPPPAPVQSLGSVGEEDVTQRKLFVRGLSWETETGQLLEAFQSFGEIEEGIVCLDRATQKSKGFGFITFKTRASTLAALSTPGKMIGDRMTQCKLASEGAPQKQAPAQAQAIPQYGAPGQMYGAHAPQPMAPYGMPQYGAPDQPPPYQSGGAAYGAPPQPTGAPPQYGRGF